MISSQTSWHYLLFHAFGAIIILSGLQIYLYLIISRVIYVSFVITYTFLSLYIVDGPGSTDVHSTWRDIFASVTVSPTQLNILELLGEGATWQCSMYVLYNLLLVVVFICKVIPPFNLWL